ncbi:uncharacterized protein LOC132702861 [Cylas formicarius]|uniref:uncharacterized protein LOC132702861 n=1 Tax=Cylas formicarius TaxID=197179 RepID=UPI002958337C|nr:uncharacterized protein LOC132702861 [Cylas formicarius]
MPKEKESKIKWEKNRRHRLNEAFNNLNKVLPCFDPSVKLSKIVIIENAISTIKDLDEKVKKILSSESEKDDTKVEIITKFESRIKKLHLRNGFLSKVINDAGIKIPAGYGTIKKRLPKLSNKITPQQAKFLQEKADIEKENVAIRNRAPPRKKKAKINDTSPLRKTLVDSLKNKTVIYKSRRKFNQVPNQKCVIILSQPGPVNNQCYIIAGNSKKKTPTVLTNSTLLRAPLATPSVKPSIFPNAPVQGLGPGTLVLANGTVFPINQNPQSISTPTIITTPIQNNSSAVIIVSKFPTTNTSNKVVVSQSLTTCQNVIYKNNVARKDSLPKLKPKSWLTQTTQVIKLPIPALTSRYNSVQHLKNSGVEKKKSFKGTTVKDKVKSSDNQELKKRKSDLDTKTNIKRPKNDSLEESTSEGSGLVEPPCTISSIAPSNQVIDQENIVKPVLEAAILSDVGRESKQTNLNSKIDCSSELLPTSESGVSTSQTEEISDQTKDKSNFVDTVTAVPSCQQEIIENVMSDMCNTEHAALQETSNVVTVEEEKLNTDLPVMETVDIEAPTTQTATEGIKNIDINLAHSDLSNDIFASLQVPPGCQNPESTSPTAAFLLAFPLVSTGAKVTEVIDEENQCDSQSETPNLLQIGSLDSSKPKQGNAENLTPSLLNIDNFSFFSSKEICGGFYNSYNSTSTNSVGNSNANAIKDVISTLNDCENHTVVAVSSQASLVRDRKPDSSAGMKEPFDKVKTTKQEPKMNEFSNFETAKCTNTISVSNCNSNVTHEFPLNYDSVKGQTGGSFHGRVQGNPQSTSDYGDPHKLSAQYRSEKDANVCNQNQINFQHASINNHSLNSNTDIDNFSNFNNLLLPTALSNCKTKDGHMQNTKPKDYLNKSYDFTSNYNNQKNGCSYASVETNKNNNAFYSNANNCSYSYPSDLNFPNNYFKNVSANEPKSDYACYDNCSNYRKPDMHASNNYCSNIQPIKNAYSNNQTKAKPQQSKPINWMTGDNSANCKFDYFVPPFSKESDFGHNLYYNSFGGTSAATTTYFGTPSIYTATDHSSNAITDLKKNIDLPLSQFNYNQKTDADENQFSWSPSKVPQFLDHSHSFVSSSLPTLVGDLALNTSQYPEPKVTKDRKESVTKMVNYDSQINQSNFLSVSQLVEHSKDPAPVKTAARRNSGNARTKSTTPKCKRAKQDAKDAQIYQKPSKNNQVKNAGSFNIIDPYDQKHQSKSIVKNVSSSYSAEALIGHQAQSNHKTSVSNFLPENIISYIPSMDSQASQASCYIQQNQNYQTTSFPHNLPPSFQNNSFTTKSFIPSVSTLTTTYLPTTGFPHDGNVQEFYTDSFNVFQNNGACKDKSYKECGKQTTKVDKILNAGNCKKATRKKNPNDNILPAFDIPFLSMPGSINSPILPDDFHHTTFLPPTPYPCKNPLYPKQNTDLSGGALLPSFPPVTGTKSGLQHPDVSPSVNSGGTSLTNFNLSTIFPEITKGPLPNVYPDHRGKEQSRNFATTSSNQVPFISKSSFSFNSYSTS